jgi:hypothetical protein
MFEKFETYLLRMSYGYILVFLFYTSAYPSTAGMSCPKSMTFGSTVKLLN